MHCKLADCMFEFDGYKVLQRLIIIGGDWGGRGLWICSELIIPQLTDSNHNICLLLTWILGSLTTSPHPLYLSKIGPQDWDWDWGW